MVGGGEQAAEERRRLSGYSLKGALSEGEGEEREVIAVERIGQVKNVGEAGAGGEIFIPGTVGFLAVHQELEAAAKDSGDGVLRGEEREQGPGGLGGRAGRGHEAVAGIAGATFTPATVGILDRDHPAGGLANGVRGVEEAGGAQTANG